MQRLQLWIKFRNTRFYSHIINSMKYHGTMDYGIFTVLLSIYDGEHFSAQALITQS